MSAAARMPYFINPSIPLSRSEKIEAYELVKQGMSTMDKQWSDMVKMVTLNSLIKTYIPYAYWVGFYIMKDGRLELGPYQGTLGCIFIDIGKGVCGRCALERSTQIVENCHALVQGEEHIACDPNSLSEIVVPVFRHDGELFAVLDIDSTLKDSFDDIDATHLEAILVEVFSSHS